MRRDVVSVLVAALAFAASAETVVENAAFRLTVGDDAVLRSLVVKATGEECLDLREGEPLFAVTQERPFNNETKLAHPNKRTTYFRVDRSVVRS